MNNKKASVGELEILRIKAVESVIKYGLTQTKACLIFGFSATSMCKYIKDLSKNTKKYKEKLKKISLSVKKDKIQKNISSYL